MTNQIEQLQSHFYNLPISQKRGFIEDLQGDVRRSDNPEWIAYIQPFLNHCIAEYNNEITRLRTAAESARYCTCGYQLSGSERFCDRCGEPIAGSPHESGRIPAPQRPSQAPSGYPVPAVQAQAPSGYSASPVQAQAPSGYPAPPVQAQAPGSYQPAPPPQPGPSTYGASHHPQFKLEDTLTGIVNAVPVTGSSILFVVGVLMVVLHGAAILLNSSAGLDALVQMDIFVPLRGMSWSTYFIIESAHNLFIVIVGVMGIAGSMRSENARRCRTLGGVAIICRILFTLVSWNALRNLPDELSSAISGAVGGLLLLSILAWVLPVVYILAAHKILATQAKTA